MKAAIVDAWGAIPAYTDALDQVRDDALVVDVEASALTNLTRGLVSGTHYASREIQLPAVPGVDGVVRLQDGRRVYNGALAAHGMMAERTLISPHGMYELPAEVDSVTAAAVPNPGISAWTSLEHAAAVTAGDSVLVLGATGVTGATAVQLAKSVFGAGRVVVGRDAARLDWLGTVGADEAITLSSHPSAHYHRTRFVQVGSMVGPNMNLAAGILRSTGIVMTGVGLGSVPPEVLARVHAEALPRLFDMVANGALELRTRARPLAEIADAWTASEPSGTRVVLTP